MLFIVFTTLFICSNTHSQELNDNGRAHPEAAQFSCENWLLPETEPLVLTAHKQFFSEQPDYFLHPELCADQTTPLFYLNRAAIVTRPSPYLLGRLNGFGRGIALTANPNLGGINNNAFIVSCGYAYIQNPFSTDNTTNLQGTQTSYAVPGLARYNYITGAVDSTFGVNKHVYTILKSSGYALRVVITPAVTVDTQKIIIVGHTYNLVTDQLATNNANRYQLFVIRYNWDGSLDTAFNPKGETPGVALLSLTDFSASATSAGFDFSTAALSNSFGSYLPSQGYAMALDANNNIIVVGNANGMLLIARYLGSSNPSAGTYAGTLDTTFNPQGYIYDLTKPYNPVAVQTQNNVGVIGDPGIPGKPPLKGNPGTFMCSILGTPTFANQGLNVVGNDSAFAVDLDPIGNIIVAGFGYQAVPGSQTGAIKALLLKITPTGTFDPTFGKLGNGTVTTSLFNINTRSYSVVVNKIGTPTTNPNYGTITVAGDLRDSFWNSYIMAARFLPTGLPDATFGPGKINGLINPNAKGIVFFAIQTLSSTTNAPTTASISNPGSAFYTVNSSNSQSGLNMTTAIEYPSVFTTATALRLQPDGKVVLSGYTLLAPGATLVGIKDNFTASGFTFYSPITSMIAARITTNGLLDPTFNSSQAGVKTQTGVAIVPIRGETSYDDQAFDLVVLPNVGNPYVNGNILLAGQSKDNSFDYASLNSTAQLYSFATAELSNAGKLLFAVAIN